MNQLAALPSQSRPAPVVVARRTLACREVDLQVGLAASSVKQRLATLR